MAEHKAVAEGSRAVLHATVEAGHHPALMHHLGDGLGEVGRLRPGELVRREHPANLLRGE